MVRHVLILMTVICLAVSATADPLPSWIDTPVKAAVMEWVDAVTDADGPDFIPAPERVAVFDNDGTFWCERPDYPSTLFQASLVRSFAAEGRIDGSAMPFSAWIDDDRDALRDFGMRQAYATMNKAFGGMPSSAYRDSALAFVDRSVHPKYGVRFDQLYYDPMLELARLLESRGFQVWVVTGSEQDFIRSFIERATGIPPERVIGSWTPAVSSQEGDEIKVVRGEVQVYNGHQAKPGNIDTRIGRRPVFSAGNSDNDQPMCRYTLTGKHRALVLWIHHDDDGREYDYDHSTGTIADLVEERADALEVSVKRDWGDLYRYDDRP